MRVKDHFLALVSFLTLPKPKSHSSVFLCLVSRLLSPHEPLCLSSISNRVIAQKFGNFALDLSFSVAVNSKIHVYCGRSRNLSVVKSQRYFISERLFFPLHEQQGKIAKIRKYITYLLLWESGFLASVMLNDAHQAATYEENWWLWTYQKVHTLQTILEPLS